jgi:hypothetical protein
VSSAKVTGRERPLLVSTMRRTLPPRGDEGTLTWSVPPATDEAAAERSPNHTTMFSAPPWKRLPVTEIVWPGYAWAGQTESTWGAVK